MDNQIDEIEAAVKLLECKRFRWICGMRTACGVRVKKGWQIDTWLPSFHVDDSPVADLSDPATKGCLLMLVREVSEDKSAYCCRFEEGWCVYTWPEPGYVSYFPTEGLALADYILNRS